MVVVFAIVHHIPPIETMQMSSVVAAAARAGCDRIVRLHFCVLKYVERSTGTLYYVMLRIRALSTALLVPCIAA